MGFPSPTTDLREIQRELSSAQDRLLDFAAVGNPVVVVRMVNPRTYYVASTLLNFDREVRRSVRAIETGAMTLSSAVVAQFDTEGGYEARSGLRATFPVPPGRASLGVSAAREGSSVVLLDVLGTAVSALTSQPVSVFLNTIGLYTCAKSVMVWFSTDNWRPSRRNDKAAHLDVDPLDVLEDPEVYVEFPSRLETADFTMTGPGTLTWIKDEPDGTSSIIRVELK